MLLVVVAIVHSERRDRVQRRVRVVSQLFDVCDAAATDLVACCEDASAVFATADQLSSADSDSTRYARRGRVLGRLGRLGSFKTVGSL
jgi:hypothetical protein